MSSYIERLQNRTDGSETRRRVLALSDEDAAEVLGTLSSDTSRRVYRSLFDAPATPSELAERHDLSLQNVHYHLSNLDDAGLVATVDTVYSEKGQEMTVYGPASDPLVLVGEEGRATSIDRSLRNVVTGLGGLAVASLLVQWGAERLARGGGASAAEPAGLGPVAGEPVGTLSWLVFGVLEPGLVFFVACLVLAAVAVRLGE
jgi:DNA-binding transcriptional ArsR family regulator